MYDEPTEAAPTQPAWADIRAYRPLQPEDPREVGGYRLRARIGEGGMGRVYLSYTPGGRPVAIKVIRTEYADDPGFRRRFEQEVATAQRVQGMYTAPVIDADTRAEQPWLATAYVAGPSLQQAIGVYGPLPEESMFILVAGVAEALQSIHGAGIVHRDLKPSNVILAADGPRVIDFGIARAVDTTSVTQTGLRVGTPAFMAPEQVRGQPSAPALDIFALGSLACYAATGELPFGGGLDPLVPHRILEQEPDLAACPERIRNLVTRCLAKDPRQRPSPTQVIELCRQLSIGTRLQMGEGWLPPAVAAAVHRIATTPVPAPTERRQPARPSRRMLVLTTGFIVVAAAAGITTAAVAGAFRTTATGSPPGSSSIGPTYTQESSILSQETSSSTTSSPLATSSAAVNSTSKVLPTSNPSGAPLPSFAPSNEAVRGNGQIVLHLNDGFTLTGWYSTTITNDIQFIEAGLTGLDGTQFALLQDGADNSFVACRDQTSWMTAINWTQVHRGSFACLRRSDGRRGILRIDMMPNFEDNEPVTILTGSLWERVVDR